MVLGGVRLLVHLDLVVIDEEQHGRDWVDDQLEEDVVVEDLLDGLDGVRRGREEHLGFEEGVRLKPCPILNTNPSVYKLIYVSATKGGP